jgi:hypothetical protein
MTKYFPVWKFALTSLFFIFIISCGEDMVEDVIETFKSGNKKVYVRYHPGPKILEKHFYNAVGEMIYLERDSLSFAYYFKKFMKGTWIMERMTVDDEILFEMETIFNPKNPPNIYTFSSKYLKVSGPQYSADYKIEYKDSNQVELDGKWTYGIEGEDTYRTKRIYNIKYFPVLSYYNFIWTDFLNDTEKEEEVLFRRVNLPAIK